MIQAARSNPLHPVGHPVAICAGLGKKSQWPPILSLKYPGLPVNARHSRWFSMLKVKDTLRATVYLGFDGRVVKNYLGPDAVTRFENEVKVLQLLDERGCKFVPKLLAADREKLQIITSNCGSRVQHLDAAKTKELFAELEPFGVRHDDPDMRNVTYRPADGRFCLIDFEFATLLPGFEEKR